MVLQHDMRYSGAVLRFYDDSSFNFVKRRKQQLFHVDKRTVDGHIILCTLIFCGRGKETLYAGWKHIANTVLRCMLN